MAAIPSFETLGYEEDDGVAWVTLDRPDVYNAFNAVMQRELRTLWRALRRHDDVRAVVLTGAGDKAFCTGIDRNEALATPPAMPRWARTASRSTSERRHAVHVRRPGRGPRPEDLRPVEAGHRRGQRMACGGPSTCWVRSTSSSPPSRPPSRPARHLRMAAAFEPLQLTGRMPFGELARMTLLGASERMSAQRAHQIGFVSELATDVADLRDKAAWAARAIADARPWPSRARSGRCGPAGTSPAARRWRWATPSWARQQRGGAGRGPGALRLRHRLDWRLR